jgi:uncharacterized protein YhbP (UPF0306 family)
MTAMSVTLLSPDYPSERLYNSVARLLAANKLCSIATQRENREVHINTAFFAFGDDLDLHFLSNPASVHCQNLISSPQVAIAVFDSHQIWGAAHKGLQLFGICALAAGIEEKIARELYSSRFPLFMEFRDRLSHLRFYRFTTAAVRLLDEDEFGEEVIVSAEVVR